MRSKPAQTQIAARLRPMAAWLLVALSVAFGFYCVNVSPLRSRSRFASRRASGRRWPRRSTKRAGPSSSSIRPTGMRFNEDLSVNESPTIGAWHPPLYLYTLAASMAVLGTHSPYRLRLVGAVGLMASIVLLFLIAREVTLAVAPRRWCNDDTGLSIRLPSRTASSWT